MPREELHEPRGNAAWTRRGADERVEVSGAVREDLPERLAPGRARRPTHGARREPVVEYPRQPVAGPVCRDAPVEARLCGHLGVEREKRLKYGGIVLQEVVCLLRKRRYRPGPYPVEIVRHVDRDDALCEVQGARRKLAVLPLHPVQALKAVRDQVPAPEHRELQHRAGVATALVYHESRRRAVKLAVEVGGVIVAQRRVASVHLVYYWHGARVYVRARPFCDLVVDFLERPLRNRVVAVEEDDVLARRHVYPRVARGRARPAARAREHPEARVLRHVLAYELFRLVLRSLYAEYAFPVGERLLQQ